MKTKMLVLIAPIIMLMTSMSYAQTINYSPKLVLNMVPNGNGTYTAATGGTGSQTVISMPQPILLMCSGPSAGQYSACPSGGGGTGTINPGTINVVPAYTGTGTTIGPTGCTIASSIETCLGFIAAGGTNNGNLSLTAVGVVPGTTANSITLTTPNSVTAYVLELPAAAPTSGNTFLSCTAAAPSVCSFAAAGSGSGTVTSFSAGTLSPLFTTSVATATSTPALTFTLSSAAANTVFGNATGSSAAPGFTTNPVVGTISTNSTGNGYYGFALSGITTCTGATPTCSAYLSETAAGILSVDTSTQGNGLGSLRLQQILPIGTAPTCVMGAAAGTTSGASCTSITGTNLSGRITVTTGTGTTASAVLFTLTWNGSPLGTAPNACPIQATSVNAIGQVAMVYPSYPSTTGLVVNVAGSAVPISTAYTYSYGPCI